jgi:predicted ATPase
MRIAIAGAHAVGKSTLAADLARTLPGYRVVEEAYYQLEAEGHLFADAPSLEDFEAQLERSLRCIREEQGEGAVIFDRSPADYLAYMLAHREVARATLADWFPVVRKAFATLDLIVFVPVERPDRITVAREEARLRRRVDRMLHEALVVDDWGLGGEVLTVSGAPGERVTQVLARIRAVLAEPSIENEPRRCVLHRHGSLER